MLNSVFLPLHNVDGWSGMRVLIRGEGLQEEKHILGWLRRGNQWRKGGEGHEVLLSLVGKADWIRLGVG